MFKKNNVLCWFLCLATSGGTLLQAQTVTVNPTEYPDALANPLMGFREDFTALNTPNWNAKPYQTIARHYIYWRDIENLQTDGVQKIKDYCNQAWAGCEAANVKIIPRVILQYGDGEYYFPSYLPTPSASNLAPWKSQALRTAVTNMIAKLGQAWDNDPRVAWVQTGIIGKWGEQESDVGVNENVVAPDNANWATIMGPAFAAAFPNKLQGVRNQQYWTQPMSIYWDSFAHQGQYSGAWANIKSANAAGRYLVAPIEGEVAYNWGTFPSYGGSNPTATLSTPAYYNYIIDSIKQLHCSGLGWISGYTVGAATATGANLVQKAFGYRFHITEFQCSARTEPGSTLTLSAKVKNTGSAVMFENYPVAFVLVDESTRQIVHQSVISGTDIRTWRPGSNYDWDPQSNPNGSKVYLTPPVENTINASIPIPSNIAPGQYLAGIAILEPSTQKPAVFFSVPNFFKQSQSQPLCRIGIGADAPNNIVTGPFDSLLNDDTRYYTTNQVGGTTVIVTATDASAGEPSNSGTFTFTRSGSTTGALTVNFTVGGTASGSDYQSLGTSVTIADGQASATKTVTVTDDGTYEGSETVIVTVGSGAGYNIGSPSSATVTIADDEVFVGEALPWVEDFQSLADGTTSDGLPTSWTATPTTGGFRVLAGEMAFNNVGADGVFTSGAINIASGPVTVSLKVRGGSGLDLGQDFLRFYKKVDGGAEVLIAGADGPQAAATWTGNVTGSNLVLVVRAHVTATTEYYYFDDLIVTNSAPVVPTVTVAATDASAAEPADNGLFTFTRSGSTVGALTVNFTVGGTASGSDYQSLGTSVTIADGQASATAAVTVIDDATVESSETVIVTLGSGAGYTVGSPSSATVNIVSDDLPSVTVAATDASAAEPADNGLFTFTRSGSTVGALTVNFTVGGTASGSDYASLGTSVTIADGQASATAAVTVVDDATVESSETVIVTLGSGAGYTVGSPSSATVNIVSDDLPSVTVAATDASAAEPADNGLFTFTRSGSTVGALTVNFTVTGTATVSSDYQSLGSSVTIADGQASATKAVTVVDDTTAESGETVIVTLTSGAGYTNGSPSSATVSIADDGDGSTPANVGTLTGWVSGNTNPKVNGTNRLMTVMVMGESTGDFSATGVTYGGQAMTKQTERLHVNGSRTYAAVFTLNEAGVNAATSGTIAVSWSTTPSAGSSIYSVLLSNADQTTPVSATANNGLDGTVITTTALTPGSGDLVVVCGATANNNAVTFNNGFVEQFESNSGWGDGTGGSKAGSGTSETPSFTQSASGRMVICAIVVKKAGSSGGVLPSPWQTADIGAVAAVGSASFSSPTWTIAGSGVDILNAADEFRYVHQSASSDCSIVARVASLGNTDPWAKAGVMIRESTAANAINMFVCVTPTNGVAVTWRATTGGVTDNTTAVVTGQAAPKWLRITRTGNAFAASYSNDGTTWTQVGTTQTITMATSATIGLAVTSHNDGVLCTSTVDNVTATP